MAKPTVNQDHHHETLTGNGNMSMYISSREQGGDICTVHNNILCTIKCRSVKPKLLRLVTSFVLAGLFGEVNLLDFQPSDEMKIQINWASL